jgi:hypothetical protein
MVTGTSDFETVLGWGVGGWAALILVWGRRFLSRAPHPKFETRQNLANYIDFIEI